MKKLLFIILLIFSSNLSFSQVLKPNKWYVYKGKIIDKKCEIILCVSKERYTRGYMFKQGIKKPIYLLGNYINGLLFLNDSIEHASISLQEVFDTSHYVNGYFMQDDINVDFKLSLMYKYPSKFENATSFLGYHEGQAYQLNNKIIESLEKGNLDNLKPAIVFPLLLSINSNKIQINNKTELNNYINQIVSYYQKNKSEILPTFYSKNGKRLSLLNGMFEFISYSKKLILSEIIIH